MEGYLAEQQDHRPAYICRFRRLYNNNHMLRCPWRRNEIDTQSMHPALIPFGFGLRVDQPERVLQDQISRL